MVVLCQWSLSFENLDGNDLLIVLIRCEHLRFLCWNVRSLCYDLTENTSDSLDAQGKGSGINNNNISVFTIFTTNYTALNSSSVADSLIRVDSGVWFLSVEKFFH